MPRVKFDYIVSFSSEDPEHPTSNLLSMEVSKKKWLCAAGESSGSVVLQLDKAVQLCTVAVGAHHTALVEVLVGRSETLAMASTSTEPYQVLVASCVFLSPPESRKVEGGDGGKGVGERVRSFSGTEGVWAQRWDRVRVLVSQPYNKHCKFGLSFIHVFSPDTTAALVTVPTRASLVSALDNPSSDEDEFKPGELFAQHKTQANSNTTTDTVGEIRRASSQLVRASSSGATPLLVKTPRDRRGAGGAGAGACADNNKTIPCTTSSSSSTTTSDNTRPTDDTNLNSNKRNKRDRSTERDVGRKRRVPSRDTASTPTSTSTPTTYKHTGTDTEYVDKRNKNRDNLMKTTRDIRQKPSPSPSPPAPRAAPRPLAGVVCVLSGYENPRRTSVRNAALALGATVLRDWNYTCTHLICAFPKTPKLRAVRSEAGGRGARVPAVLAEWVEECARLGRRLPEEWYSTEPERRVPPPEGGLDPAGGEGQGEGDTDDEIERVLRGQRDRPRDTSPPPSPLPAGAARASTIATPLDHQTQGSMSEESSDDDGDYGGTTDHDADADTDVETDDERDVRDTLPPLLRDMVFLSGGELVDRYVRAYGGTVIPLAEDASGGGGGGSGAVYALCEGGAGAAPARAGVRRLPLRWLWRAHHTRTLPPLHTYTLD